MANIKVHFVPPKDHFFLEGDYQALEIRVLALASQDPALIADLNSGVDLHTMFASKIFDKDPDDITLQERKLAKGFSFQLQYGAGPDSIAAKWGVDRSLALKFIDSYYDRYGLVAVWQQMMKERTKEKAEYIGVDQKSSLSKEQVSVKSSRIPSIWERELGSAVGGFYIDETEVSYNPGTFNFSPTAIKNFPIQGGAADIVLCMLDHLRKNWKQHELYRYANMHNTVHDSFLFSVHKSTNLMEVTTLLENILEDVPSVLKDIFGIHSPIEFPTDWKAGRVWGYMADYDYFAKLVDTPT